jgi:hypothetical protein
MSNIAIRKRRASTTQLSTITGTVGEVWIDTQFFTVVVHDGTTAGGWPLAHEVHTHPNATTGTAGFMSASDKTKLDDLSAAGGVQVVENNGTPLPAETTINFDTNFTLTDNPGASRTDITLSTTFFNEINNNTVALILALG